MKRFLIVIFVILLIPITAFAEDYSSYLDAYDLSSFENNLDDDTYSYLKNLGLDSFDYNSLSSLSLSDVVELLKNIFLGRVETPLESSIIVLVFVLLSSFLQSFNVTPSESLTGLYSTSSALIISTILMVKMSHTISISVLSISVASNFIYAFVPAFCAIVIASGGTTTAFSTNTLLLTLSQGLTFISSNMFVPLINCFMCIGICSSLNSELRLEKLLYTLRRILTTAISFCSACFVSILSIKTAIASKADAIGLRSVRFAINSVVPVIGSAISEGLLSIQGYSSLIKSSVGMVGIIAIALVFIPSIIEVVIWRFMLSVCGLVSDIFCDNSVSQTLGAFRDTMLLINVVLILSMVTTIISFGILIAARTS